MEIQKIISDFGLDWSKMNHGNGILIVVQSKQNYSILDFRIESRESFGRLIESICKSRTIYWSGNYFRIVEVFVDCDRDTIVFQVEDGCRDFILNQPILNLMTECKRSDWIVAIAQDFNTKEVLMVGVMTAETLRLTRDKGNVVFWSRSRNEIWEKGASSGNVLRVKSFLIKPDQSALVVLVDPVGQTCHTGAISCFRQEDGGLRHLKI